MMLDSEDTRTAAKKPNNTIPRVGIIACVEGFSGGALRWVLSPGLNQIKIRGRSTKRKRKEHGQGEAEMK